MAVTWLQPPRVSGRLQPKAVFSISLIVVTLLPMAAILLQRGYAPASAFIGFLVALSATHVFSTCYLLTDPDVRQFAWQNPIRMIAVPILLTGIILVAFLVSGPLFVVLVLGAVLYQSWHFGAQNIGVSSFISFAERHRPLSLGEKRIIRIGIVCGMAGVLQMVGPTYGYPPGTIVLWPWVTKLLAFTYAVGMLAAIGISLVAAYFAFRAWRAGHLMTAVALFLSICFQLPMYATNDGAIGLLAFATAHGLQYLVFLSAHSMTDTARRTAWKFGIFIAPSALILVALFGHVIWTAAPTYQPPTAPLIGMALLGILTVNHFWFDQYLWKMKERGKWMKDRFGFVFS